MARRLKATLATAALVVGFLAVISTPAQAAAANQSFHSVTVFESQSDGTPNCSRGTFDASGVITDSGIARLCDRHGSKLHTLVGEENLAGAAGHYVLHYKVRCTPDYLVCDGTWTIDQPGLHGRGTTHQVATDNPDGTQSLDSEFTGRIG